jgi:hypothetical protein
MFLRPCFLSPLNLDLWVIRCVLSLTLLGAGVYAGLQIQWLGTSHKIRVANA